MHRRHLVLELGKPRGGGRHGRSVLVLGALTRGFGVGQCLLECLPVGEFLRALGVELRLTLRGLVGSSLPLGDGLLLRARRAAAVSASFVSSLSAAAAVSADRISVCC